MSVAQRMFGPPQPEDCSHVAYCLAILEGISYTTNQSMLTFWANSFGFPIAQFIPTPDYITPNVMIAGNQEQMVVAVPGTTNPAQMYENIFYGGQRNNSAFGTGEVHSFFLWCAESIVQHLSPGLALFPQLKEVTFVGHSLGGAVVQLLADWVERNTNIAVKFVLTLNAPRVGEPAWANRFRTYPTYLFYNSHDVVCEVPLPVDWHYDGNEVYELHFAHRDTLVRVESRQSAGGGWFRQACSALNWGTRGATLAAPAVLTSSDLFARAQRGAGRGSLGGLIVLGTNWAIEHGIAACLDNLEDRPDFGVFPEIDRMRKLRFDLSLTPWAASHLSPRTGDWVPVGAFAPGHNPGGGGASNVPTIPMGARYEIVEAEIEWTHNVQRGPSRLLISDNVVWVEDMFAASATSPTGNPLAAGTPIPSSIPQHPNWVFSDNDRRILEKAIKVMSAVDARDITAYFAPLTAAISTRSPIIDVDDVQLSEDWASVKSQIEWLLSLYY